MRRGLFVAAALYVAALAALVPGMFALRRDVLATFGQPQELRQWEAWRAAAAESPGGPVARRVPKSTEPPALVLMRDYFPTVLAAAALFGSLLYWVLALAIRGALGPAPRRPPPQANGEPGPGAGAWP